MPPKQGFASSPQGATMPPKHHDALDRRIFLSILDLDSRPRPHRSDLKDASVKGLFAPFAVLVFAGSALASPFVLEELVREGDVLPGLDKPVFTIGVPSINSSGEWAIPVSSPSPSQPIFQSGVLGNNGFRITPGFDPDGSASAVRTRYDSASIRDDGVMAVVANRLVTFGPSELWLEEQQAATSPGAPFKRVSALDDGTLIGSISTGVGGFNVLATPNGQGGWDSGLVHGFGTEIPVGSVLLAPTSGFGYARNESGRQAWLGRIDPNGGRGEPEWMVAVDDQIIAANGQPSQIPDYMFRPSGGTIAMQSDGDVFFASALEWNGDGPGSLQNGIFSEDGNPVLTSLDHIQDLNELGGWRVTGDGFHVDEASNFLWIARAITGPGPDDPFGVTRSALMFNDQVIAQTGDVLADGSIVLSPTGIMEMSPDGNWVIAELVVRDHLLGDFDAIYRIAVPTPGVLALGVVAGFGSMRRRRQLAG